MAPLTVLGGLAFACYLIYKIEFNVYSNYSTVSLYSLSLLVPLGVAVHYASGLRLGLKWGLTVLAFVVVGVQWYAQLYLMMQSTLVSVLQVLMVHLLVALAPYTLWKNGMAFWAYNAKLLGEYLRTAFLTSVLTAGLLAAIGSVEWLFGLKLRADGYLYTIIVCASVVHPCMFLANLPWQAEQNVTAQELNYPKLLRNLVQYVLLPLVVLYILILYGYGIKLLLGNVEKALVGWLVLVLTLVGLVAYLLAWPLLHKDNEKWVRTWDKLYWVALVPLCALLFWSMTIRVQAYGLTENRVMLYYLAAWLAVVVAYMQFVKKHGVVFIPLSLLVVCLQAAYGFENAHTASVANQTYRLQSIIEKYKIKPLPVVVVTDTVDVSETPNEKGYHMSLKVFPADSVSPPEQLLASEDYKQLRGAIEYLGQTYTDLAVPGFITLNTLPDSLIDVNTKVYRAYGEYQYLSNGELLNAQLNVTSQQNRTGIEDENDARPAESMQAEKPNYDFDKWEMGAFNEPARFPKGHNQILFSTYSASPGTDWRNDKVTPAVWSKPDSSSLKPELYVEPVSRQIVLAWHGHKQTILKLMPGTHDYKSLVSFNNSGQGYAPVTFNLPVGSGQVFFERLSVNYTGKDELESVSFNAVLVYEVQ